MSTEADEEWFMAWVNTWGDRLAPFIKTYMPDHQEAQDIAPETVLRLYQDHYRFPNKPLSPGWLSSVARNLIRDAQRRSSRTIMQDPVEPPYHAHDSVASRLAVQMTRIAPTQDDPPEGRAP